jgi:hypothetical protein
VTSISSPNAVLKSLAEGARARRMPFYLIGDAPGPADFRLDGCSFYDLAAQRRTGLRIAAACPERHYSRKNVGYLLAMLGGADVIVETDDDNAPRPGFWKQRERTHVVPLVKGGGWVNVYRWYTPELVWPRGFPLEHIQRTETALAGIVPSETATPIQQGLADGNPDVDAIYRLTGKLPLRFTRDVTVALGEGSWCPLNSQNTTWFAEAFPLLYLPACCSFRMTDIWRSFVAQRIAWTNGWSVLFHGTTVEQERNEHRLLADFRDEIPGYLNVARIRECLEAAPLRDGAQHITDNLLVCYEQMVRLGVVGEDELTLLNAWIDDYRECGAPARRTFTQELLDLGASLAEPQGSEVRNAQPASAPPSPR